MYPFASLEDVERTLGELAERELAQRVPRRPGEREDRYRQLLGGDEPPAEAAPEPTPVAPPTAPPPAPAQPDDGRIAELEERVDHLAEQVEWLRREVVRLRDESRAP